MWLIGKLPNETMGRLLIGALAVLLLALSMAVIVREGSTVRGLICGLLMSGALLPGWLEQIYVMPEVWAGILIALSICAYGLRRSGWGIAFGLSAVVVARISCTLLRHLPGAGPQRSPLARTVVVVRRAGSVYLVFYAWHAHHVLSLMEAGDHAHPNGWLQFGGAPFVIAVSQMNAYLLLLPQWVSAIYLPLAMLGFAGWNTATGVRAGLTASAFVILFAFIGQPFNQYWGSMVAPLLTLGVAQAPLTIADLVRRSRDLSNQKTCSAASELECVLSPCSS